MTSRMVPRTIPTVRPMRRPFPGFSLFWRSALSFGLMVFVHGQGTFLSLLLEYMRRTCGGR